LSHLLDQLLGLLQLIWRELHVAIKVCEHGTGGR
jgi:hypothetical protein